MTITSIDHILDLTHQLPREQRKLLIAGMEREFAEAGDPQHPPLSSYAL